MERKQKGRLEIREEGKEAEREGCENEEKIGVQRERQREKVKTDFYWRKKKVRDQDIR